VRGVRVYMGVATSSKLWSKTLTLTLLEALLSLLLDVYALIILSYSSAPGFPLISCLHAVNPVFSQVPEQKCMQWYSRYSSFQAHAILQRYIKRCSPPILPRRLALNPISDQTKGWRRNEKELHLFNFRSVPINEWRHTDSGGCQTVFGSASTLQGHRSVSWVTVHNTWRKVQQNAKHERSGRRRTEVGGVLRRSLSGVRWPRIGSRRSI